MWLHTYYKRLAIYFIARSKLAEIKDFYKGKHGNDAVVKVV